MRQIRHSIESDAERIRDIALSVVVPRDSIEHGFVEYTVPSLEIMRNRIHLGSFFLSAVEEDCPVVGYLAAFRGTELEDPRLDFSGDEIAQQLLGRFNCTGEENVYLDQLAMAKRIRRGRTALDLMRTLETQASGTGVAHILTAASHAPHRNDISIAIVRYFGFEQLGEIGVYNGLRFGIYQKVLKPHLSG
jgi:hypothetical protein